MVSLRYYFFPVSIHPLACITLAFILGIWLRASLDKGLQVLTVIMLSLLILLVFSLITQNIQTSLKKLIFYILLACLGGFLRYHYQIYSYEQSSLPNNAISFDIIGHITNYSKMQNSTIKNCVTIHITKIKSHDISSKWDIIDKKILLYTPSKLKIHAGDILQMDNIKIQQKAKASFKQYLIKEGLMGTVFTSKFEYKIIEHPMFCPSRWIFDQKESLLQELEKKLTPETFTLFSSLFLGNRSINKKYMEATSEQFKRWGIAHFLARSGLHLVIFVALWRFLLNLIPLSFYVKQFIILLLCCIYFVFSWSSISFIRAFASFILYKLSLLLKLQSHFLHILTLVCFTSLVINPIQLFFLDFQLSFALTFALAWFGQVYSLRSKQTAR